MVTRRTAKTKGYQMEYSVRDSLKQKYPDVLLCKEEGYTRQYDIIIPSQKIIIEVKKHKGFNWNKLEKYFLKLEKRVQANKDENDNGIYTPYLIFQGNHQPCLVMSYYYISNDYTKEINSKVIRTFEDVFGISFTKHKGNRK